MTGMLPLPQRERGGEAKSPRLDREWSVRRCLAAEVRGKRSKMVMASLLL